MVYFGKKVIRGSRRSYRVARKTAFDITNRFSDIKMLIFPAIILCLTFGTFLGAIRANIIGEQEYIRLSANLDYYIKNANIFNQINQEKDFFGVFFEAFIKYGKFPIAMWIVAFFPPCAILSLILILIKGISVGFTTALLVRNFYGQGMLYSVILYFPQNLVLIPAYIFVAYKSINFASDFLSFPKNVRNSVFFGKNKNFRLFSKISNNFRSGELSEYTVVLIISMVCVILASLIETYCIPWFIGIYQS